MYLRRAIKTSAKQMTPKSPSLGLSLVPLGILIGLLALNVGLYRDDASFGPNQIALLLAAGVATIIAIQYGHQWKEIRNGIINSISSTMTAIIILLLIGALAGTWLLSGVIPAMIYYGLQILNPAIFLFAACVICALVSLGTGSSWSTIATVGIALLGIGSALGFHEGLIAGAVISGAYFGDKMSPLSDTTNLAPAMAGTDLFTHIRHMMWTTIPAIVITLLIFLFIGLDHSGSANIGELDNILSTIDNKFNITPFLFIVPLIVIVLIIKKVAPIPALLIGTLMGGLFAIVFQPDIVREIGSTTSISTEITWNGESSEYTSRWSLPEGFDSESDELDLIKVKPGQYTLTLHNDFGLHATAEIIVPDYSADLKPADTYPIYHLDEQVGTIKLNAARSNYAISAYRAIVNAMAVQTQVDAGSESINKLLSQKGMFGMLNTIWLIICAMIFGGVMEHSGMLTVISNAIIRLAYNTGSLIAATAGTCIFFNVTASDQYLAIVVPGKMFAETYRKRGLKPENLSRTLEDSGTVTSVLVPWNTCGATQAGVLGVATATYLPFCFFNILSPIITIVYGIIGFKITYEEDNLTQIPVNTEETKT